MTKLKGNKLALDRVNTVSGWITISTVDCDGWLVRTPETAIRMPRGHWYTVQTYPNVEQAMGGHQMLVKVARLYPNILAMLTKASMEG